MRIKKLTFIIFVLMYILLNLSIVIAANNTKNNIDNYFRIHVVANSDNINDQILKLNVARNVESYINELNKGIIDKEEYINSISNNIYSILEVAQNTIYEADADYDVTAYIGKIKYDEKTKDNITMKEGIYNSLKIVIGNGNGQNWWSLLFPNSISGLEVDEVITDDNITFSSGILELFNSLLEKIDM